jgi:hypothetical protein
MLTDERVFRSWDMGQSVAVLRCLRAAPTLLHKPLMGELHRFTLAAISL